jgi:hypothetical protein
VGLLFSGASSLKPGFGHALANTAMFEEITLDTLKLSIEQITAHFDEANDDICTDFRIFVLDSLPKSLVIRIGLPVEFPQPRGIRMLRIPLRQSIDAKKIPIIGKQLFKTRPCNVGQFQLRLF